MAYKKIKNCKFCEKEFVAHNWRAEVCSHKCHLQRRKLWHLKNADKVRTRERYRYHHGDKARSRLYEKTKNGFLMRMYRNMQSRIVGIQKLKAHLYKGKNLLDRQSFYQWANNSEMFHSLFFEWKNDNYNRKLTPTVDRINSKLGYEISNMEWVTHSENSRRGSLSRRKQVKI